MSAINGNGAILAPQSLISVGQACKIAGCHPNTLRKWANSGQLPAYRVLGGKRRFLRDDLVAFLGLVIEKENISGGKILAYIRISDNKRAKGFAKNEVSDMTRQRDRIVAYSGENFNSECQVYSDINSGLNYTRKGLIRLLKEILSGQHDGSILLVSTKERLARFGVELIELICQAHSIRIIYTEKDHDESEAKELADDLLAIIHVFSSRNYAMRSAKRNRKHLSPPVVERIIELRKSGCAISKISEICNAEGLRCDDGAGVGISSVKNCLNEKLELEKTKETSIEKYVAENVVQGASGLRLKKEDFYSEYQSWCKSKGINPITSHHVGRKMTLLGYVWTAIPHEKTGTKAAWKGIYIKQRENLSVTVREKPRHKLLESPEMPETSFALYYREYLKGKFRGYSRELFAAYKTHCQQLGIKPDKFNTIAIQLLSLGGHYSKKFGTGGLLYDLTKKNL